MGTPCKGAVHEKGNTILSGISLCFRLKISSQQVSSSHHDMGKRLSTAAAAAAAVGGEGGVGKLRVGE